MPYSLKREGILFVIVGPTGSGKSTLCKRLIDEFKEDMRYSVSVTSRPPRANEIQGVSYHFISREEFVARRERGEFFEWEETHGNLYGTLRSSLENGIKDGHDLLFQIDIRGALTMKRNFPGNTVAVFVLPPSFEVLKERLRGRGTVDPEELRRRFSTAKEEYDALRALSSDKGKIDYVVLNHELEETYATVRGIVMAERSRYARLDAASLEKFCKVEEIGS